MVVLGAMSKALATIATQPLIVAKVGLQSRPPPARKGKPFKSFGEVMRYIIEKEGVLSLFKGIGPQITKGLLVQGLLMMTKERYVSMCYKLQTMRLTLLSAWNLPSLFSLPLSQRLRRIDSRRPPTLSWTRPKAAPLLL